MGIFLACAALFGIGLVEAVHAGGYGEPHVGRAASSKSERFESDSELFLPVLHTSLGPLSSTWVLGQHGNSCDDTCESFKSGSTCSADRAGLFAW